MEESVGNKNMVKLRKVYILILSLYVVLRLLRETVLFYDFSDRLLYLNYFKYFLVIVAGLKLMVNFFGHSLSLKQILIMVSVGLLLCITAYESGVEELLIIWVFICSGYDVNHKEICRFVGMALLAFVVIAFLCSHLGLIENTITERYYLNELSCREGCGFAKPYMPAHYCFFGVVAYLYSKAKRATWFELIALAVLQTTIFAFAQTKNPFVMGMFFTLLIALNKLGAFDRIADFLKDKGILSIVGCIIIIVCAAVPFVLTVKYDCNNPKWVWLSDVLSNRLWLGQDALETHGMTFFGQPIEWSSSANYNIVDSSFINIYLNYGIVLFTLLLFSYALMGYHAGRKKDVVFLIALLAVGMHSMFDCFLMMLYCNPFLLSFSYLGDNPPVILNDMDDPTLIQ